VPRDVVIPLHLNPELTKQVIQHPLVNFVSFTGSVAGGRTVEEAAVSAPGFKGVALEVCFFDLPKRGLISHSLVAKTPHMCAQMRISTTLPRNSLTGPCSIPAKAAALSR
jgi:hypothetical protein